MNIEEARKVLWLKNNHRPLGELIDEGCLTKENLEWAAQWAYNPKLQEAAKVLLNAKSYAIPAAETEKKPRTPEVHEKKASIEVEISIQEARSTLWPFSSHKDRPMGELVDSKQLSLKDLGFAIENAWDPKVRKAATALALVRLKQVLREPVPSAGFIHVVSGGRTYAERRESWLTLLEGMVLGSSIVLFVALVWWLLSGALKPKPDAVSISEIAASPTQLIVVIVVFAILMFGAWAVASIPDQITKRLEKQIEGYRRGQEGEENVVQRIVQALDGNWHLFRNVRIPGRNKGDLDLVLVGPSGVWVLEVKNFRGEYQNIGERWEYKHGKHWRTAPKNPSKQVSKNIYHLKDFLKAENVNVFVNGAIVWANPESSLFVENPSVAVWRYDRLPDELGNIWQAEKLSEVQRRKIAEKLTKLCEHQKKSH